MVDLTSPRNAIGGVSGVVTNQSAQYSNIMNRRKSNAMGNTHGPVDINAIMRATRGGANNGNEPQAHGQGQDAPGVSASRKNENKLSSRGGRAHNNLGGSVGPPQINNPKDHRVHLPPMPLTPTEQNRQRERENNHSINGATSPTKTGAKKNESRQGSSGPGGVGTS
jgi:hypothetical protein